MNDRLEIASRSLNGFMANSNEDAWRTQRNIVAQICLEHADALIALEAETRKEFAVEVSEQDFIAGHAQAIEQITELVENFKEYFGDRAFHIFKKRLASLKPEVKP